MKEKFRNKRFQSKSLDVLEKCSAIIQEYQKKNIKVTLRQLFYQLVARGFIPNLDKQYRRLSGLLTDARYCGFIDWDAIEDRIRIPHRHAQFYNVLNLVESAKYSYRLDRWKDQRYYVELITEKDALSSVLSPIANNWHIFFSVNRGYNSATAMYDVSKRILEQEGKEPILLYLGDHDPSGLDMLRDIEKRLTEFGCVVKVKHIALKIEQVQEYKLPPNPTKKKDPRAKSYINKFGTTSWEVDALPPDVMINLVNSSIEQYVDVEKMEQVQKQEKEDMKQLEEFAKQLEDDN